MHHRVASCISDTAIETLPSEPHKGDGSDWKVREEGAEHHRQDPCVRGGDRSCQQETKSFAGTPGLGR